MGRKGSAIASTSEALHLVFKGDGQEYAKLTKALENGHCEVMFNDGETQFKLIRGRDGKKDVFNTGDIVLVDNCDVILKYSTGEARKLKERGEHTFDLPDEEEEGEGNGKLEDDEDDIDEDDEDDGSEKGVGIDDLDE